MPKNVWTDGTVEIVGYASQDAEEHFYGVENKRRVDFSLVIGKDQAENSIWANCSAFGYRGSVAMDIRKGDTVLVIGKENVREYNGKVYKTINPQYLSIMKKRTSKTTVINNVTMPNAVNANPEMDEFTPITDNEGDLPF